MKFGLSNNVYDKIKEIINQYEYTFKIFGSRARGDFKNNSDIDIVVEEDVSEEKQYEIINKFDLLDIPYTIDLIFLKSITKEELINSIKRDGVIF